VGLVKWGTVTPDVVTELICTLFGTMLIHISLIMTAVLHSSNSSVFCPQLIYMVKSETMLTVYTF